MEGIANETPYFASEQADQGSVSHSQKEDRSMIVLGIVYMGMALAEQGTLLFFPLHVFKVLNMPRIIFVYISLSYTGAYGAASIMFAVGGDRVRPRTLLILSLIGSGTSAVILPIKSSGDWLCLISAAHGFFSGGGHVAVSSLASLIAKDMGALLRFSAYETNAYAITALVAGPVGAVLYTLLGYAPAWVCFGGLELLAALVATALPNNSGGIGLIDVGADRPTKEKCPESSRWVLLHPLLWASMMCYVVGYAEIYVLDTTYPAFMVQYLRVSPNTALLVVSGIYVVGSVWKILLMPGVVLLSARIGRVLCMVVGALVGVVGWLLVLAAPSPSSDDLGPKACTVALQTVGVCMMLSGCMLKEIPVMSQVVAMSGDTSTPSGRVAMGLYEFMSSLGDVTGYILPNLYIAIMDHRKVAGNVPVEARGFTGVAWLFVLFNVLVAALMMAAWPLGRYECLLKGQSGADMSDDDPAIN